MTDERFKQLPDDKDEEINDLYDAFTSAWESDDMVVAEKNALAAWEALPEPKLGWDYFSNVLPVSLTEFYRDTKRFDQAQIWLARARESYGPEEDISIEFLAGTVAYRAGDLDSAFDRFNHAYANFGKRPFDEEPEEYLKFTLDRRNK